MPKALVVDDSQAIRRFVELCLGALELEVDGVGTGASACRSIATCPPDVFLLDVGLPDVSGWDVLEFVRSDPSLDHLPVIMMTGRVDTSDVERATAAGADGYLIKPFRPADLRQIVLDALTEVLTPSV